MNCYSFDLLQMADNDQLLRNLGAILPLPLTNEQPIATQLSQSVIIPISESIWIHPSDHISPLPHVMISPPAISEAETILTRSPAPWGQSLAIQPYMSAQPPEVVNITPHPDPMVLFACIYHIDSLTIIS